MGVTSHSSAGGQSLGAGYPATKIIAILRLFDSARHAAGQLQPQTYICGPRSWCHNGRGARSGRARTATAASVDKAATQSLLRAAAQEGHELVVLQFPLQRVLSLDLGVLVHLTQDPMPLHELPFEPHLVFPLRIALNVSTDKMWARAETNFAPMFPAVACATTRVRRGRRREHLSDSNVFGHLSKCLDLEHPSQPRSGTPNTPATSPRSAGIHLWSPTREGGCWILTKSSLFPGCGNARTPAEGRPNSMDVTRRLHPSQTAVV